MQEVSLDAMAFFRTLRRHPAGLAGFIGTVFFLLLVTVGPMIVPLDTKVKIDRIYSPPSLEHPLGTDHQGRDILSQIVNGGRDLLYVAFLASVLSTAIAVVLGAVSAIVGGRLDSLLTSIVDIILTIPQFPLLAVLAAFVQLNSQTGIAILLALLSWPHLMRPIRSQVLSLKQRDYVEAAVMLDLGLRHIIFAEILPNMASYIIIHFILAMTNSMYSQVGLVFLGLVPFSSSNWATMIQLAWVRGSIFFTDSIYYIMAPIAAISLFQLSLVSFARALDEIVNPRLRTGDA